MQFDVFTLLPEVFPSYLETSILKRARDRGLIDVRVHNIRDNIMGAAHPTIQREVTSGILSSQEVAWMLIPPGGDPYAQDLIRDYWGSVREFIGKRLTGNA